MKYPKMVKWDLKRAKEYIETFGYVFIEEEFECYSKKFFIKDKIGYYYNVLINELKYYKPRFFDKSNPRTIDNIKLWCRINNKQFLLLSEEYLGCDKKLKWRCLKDSCGEIFEICWNSIYKEKGNGCHYCSGRKVCLSNCIATKNHDLSKQWNYGKNKELTPYEVTSNSHKKVWWICEFKHEWEATVNSRNCGNGCPYCSGKLPTKENNLFVNNPKLCEEWNYDKNKKHPSEYLTSTHQTVWWKCSECNYEWEYSIAERNSGKRGCHCLISSGEKRIMEYLLKENIYFKDQKTFRVSRTIS